MKITFYQALSIFLGLYLFSIISCANENIMPQIETVYESPIREELSHDEVFTGHNLSKSEYSFITRTLEELERKSKSRDYSFDFASIDPNSSVKVERDWAALKSYSFYLSSAGTSSTTFYNLIFEKWDGEWEEPFILQYEMIENYAEDFNAGAMDLGQYRGYIRKITLDFLFPQEEGRVGGYCPFEFCYELFFGDSGGGHGVFTGDGTNGSGINGNTGGGASAESCIRCVPCPCENHSCNQSGECRCGVRPFWEVDLDCVGVGDHFVGEDHDFIVGGRADCSFSACENVLIAAGINLGEESGGSDDSPPSEEACLINFTDYVKENYFTLIGFKSYDVDLLPCCEVPSSQFNECAWDAISVGYDLDFDWDFYLNNIHPFLEKHKIDFDDLVNSEADLNRCAEDEDNFEFCLFVQYFSKPESTRPRLCVSSISLEKLSDPNIEALYFKMLNFNYNFVYQDPHTWLTRYIFDLNFGDYCIQVYDNGTWGNNGYLAKFLFAKAFELSVDQTLTILNALPYDELLMHADPYGGLVKEFIKFTFDQSFKNNLSFVFQGGPSTTNGPCNGVIGFHPEYNADCD